MVFGYKLVIKINYLLNFIQNFVNSANMQINVNNAKLAKYSIEIKTNVQ